jgi:hypothetical protein
VDYKE